MGKAVLSRDLACRLVVPAIVTMAPASALAHVKWFCTNVNVAAPPAGLMQVVSPLFLSCCGGFLLLIFLGLFADGWIAQLWPAVLSSGGRLGRVEELLIRAGIGSYCVCLWNRAAVVPWGHAGAVPTLELPLLGASLGFGQLDTVGHLPIVAILLAVAVRGVTPLQDALQLTVAKS